MASKARTKQLVRHSPEEIREQEVLRARRELLAYFNGRRTEREARAALKIIKAFVRDRERTAAASRRPLPISRSGSSSKSARAPARKVSRKRVRTKIHEDETAQPAETPEEQPLRG